jgi:hypothetical protein
MPAIMIENIRGIPQSLQANAGVVHHQVISTSFQIASNSSVILSLSALKSQCKYCCEITHKNQILTIYILLYFMLRYKFSPLARTLGSLVRIPLKAWMSVCVYIVFVLFFVWVAALRRADPPSRESYRCV